MQRSLSCAYGKLNSRTLFSHARSQCLVPLPLHARPTQIVPSNVLYQHKKISVRWQSTAAPTDATSSVIAADKSPAIPMKDIKRLVALAKPERKRIALGCGFLLVNTGISMSVPLALGTVLDVFTKDSVNLPFGVTATGATIGLFLAFCVGAAANVGRIVVMRIAGQRIIADARKEAFRRVMNQDLAWFDMQGQKPLALNATKPENPEKSRIEAGKNEQETKRSTDKAATFSEELSQANSKEAVKSTGDILSRLGNDANLVGDSLTREFADALKAILTAIIGVGAMCWISGKLTILVMLLIPPSAIGAVVYGRYIKNLSRSTQKAIASMVSVAEEKISGIRTVQAFNGGRAEVKNYFERVEHIFQLIKRDAWASAIFYSGLGLIGNITIIALLSYGGSLVSHGELTIGQLTSLAFYALYVGGAVSSLTSFYSTIMRGLGASGRLFELMDAKPRFVALGVGRQLVQSEPARRIVFKNVSFAYPTRPNSPILKNINLTIEPGSSIAFAGGSGSGKSTLALLLLRFYKPSSGDILYGDESLSEITPESWRDRIAFVEQQPLLWGMTVSENISYGKPDASFEEVRQAATAANCLDFIETLPQGFDTKISRSSLSGGQIQRLAIARALIKKPKILVLDEATSALDSASEALVNEAVTKITQSQSLTTILIAHRLSTIKTADKVAFVENGNIVEAGTFEELSGDNTRFTAMVRNQMLERRYLTEQAQDENREEPETPREAEEAVEEAPKGRAAIFG